MKRPKWWVRDMLLSHMKLGLGYSMTDDGVILLNSPLDAAPSTVLELFDEEFRQLNELEVVEPPMISVLEDSIWRSTTSKRMIRITRVIGNKVGVTFRVNDRRSPTQYEMTVEQLKGRYFEIQTK